MKVVMFSINPLFADKVMGGAPKHLQNIARYLGQLGHDVTVLCTRHSTDQTCFRWHERVEVLPILPFKQPFPQPYAVPAYELAEIIQHVAQYLEQADRFYMHDGEFLFPYVYKNVPTVISLRDNVYPETLLGGFLFQGHRLILISHYARLYFEQTVGRFFPGLSDRIQVIHNGIDWERFKPTLPSQILNLVPINPTEDVVVIHPHRPEETKGIRQTIAVTDLLVHHYGFKNLKVAVPRWIDHDGSDELRAFYRSLEQEIDKRGLTTHFIFHDWIPQSLMPEYYSMGHVTLALGNFVESFGNAVYESLGCGTPVVVSRISSHRELLPERLVDKVDFDDTVSAAAKAADIITTHRRTSAATVEYLHKHYSIEQQLAAYAEAIIGADCVPDLPYQFTPIDTTTRFKMPIWCYETDLGIYNDFRGQAEKLSELRALLLKYPDGFSTAEAQTMGIAQAQIMRWHAEGYLFPIYS